MEMRSSQSGHAANPIIWADVPDLAIIRVGAVYYMTSTTMHMSPGLPVMKSTNLVNWTMAGYAYETLDDTDEMSLRNGRSAYGGGSWASSIRHHKGFFYATTFSHTTHKTYIYRTADPEKEPWELVSALPVFHDHSLFFDDDGRVYLVHGSGDIHLIELEADLSAVKKGGIDQVIVPNASAAAGGRTGLPAEGSQLFKVDGRYYLCNITWPRGGMRTEIVHRADRITGPYEGRVMFHDRGIAQGGLVDTPDGRWYAYLFQDRGAVGRIPFLIPVKWVDGWPVLGEDGRAPEFLEIKAAAEPMPPIVASDDFKRKPGEADLPLQWQWNHNPDPLNWQMLRKEGILRITTGRLDHEAVQARNTLTQRTFGPGCRGEILLDGRLMKDGDTAGLIALQRRYGFAAIKKEQGKYYAVVVKAEGGSPVECARTPLPSSKVYLRVDCMFRDLADRASFAYSLDGQKWTPFGEDLAMRYDMPHFMGYRYGLFVFSTLEAGGSADFDFFHISPLATGG